jgi:DNA-binding transcriptional ArsR family regulator
MTASSPRKSGNEPLRAAFRILHALGHPLRLQIIEFIARNQSSCVNQIYAELNIEQSVASQHLRILRQADLVNAKRNGRFVFYHLNLDKIACAAEVAEILSKLPQ